MSDAIKEAIKYLEQIQQNNQWDEFFEELLNSDLEPEILDAFVKAAEGF